MSNKREARASAWFLVSLFLAVYILVSVGLAVATSDVCDGGLDGQKTWQPFPPHWECPRR